jgi:RNA polymerase sigma-70 factor (ECF subfamily)
MVEETDKISQIEPQFVHNPPTDGDHVTHSLTGNIDLTAEHLATYLAGIQEQDEDALSQFYDQTINGVYGLALRITGKAEEAEEVVSDVYLQVWEQADRYRKEKGSIMTWLLTICRSRAIDRYRKRQQTSAEISDTQCPEITDSVGSPDYLLSNTQQHSSINLALQKLSLIQRQLISLAFFRGFTYQEIADYIDMPLGTVKSHIRRSLIELKAEPTLQFCYSPDGEVTHD